jgi:transketolase
VKCKTSELVAFAAQVRKDTIRMIGKAGSGHPGGSLSMTDILTVLFKLVMNHGPEKWSDEGRDRFILSKGHAAPALYAALAATGYFDRRVLDKFRDFGSPLQGHPDCRKLKGIEISTGSLGQGLSVAGGIALGLRAKKIDSRIYVMLGDGEIQEGQVWEAAMAIAHYRLNNVVAIVDNNNLQIDGLVEQVMNIYPIDRKFEAFGWQALNIDGHDFDAIEKAFREALRSPRPTAVIARTVKGKGVPFMENRVEFHHTANLTAAKVKEALAALDESAREAVRE